MDGGPCKEPPPPIRINTDRYTAHHREHRNHAGCVYGCDNA